MLQAPNIALALNDEQQLAYEGLLDFIDNGNHRDQYATLNGFAGTGKTYLLAKLVETLTRRRFIVAAIAHKAKEVIADKIRSRNVEPMTVAALVAMKFDDETGQFFEDPYEKELPIADADIVIIDEGSMINENTIKYIFQKKMHRTVVIFAGDKSQIRPIGNDKLNEFSPIFNNPNIFNLRNRVRQGEGNPILEHMDYYKDLAIDPSPVIKSIDELLREDEENDLGKIIYRNDMRQVTSQYLQYFQQAMEEQNTNLLKVVTYKNSSRHLINELVRSKLFDSPKEYEIGELMIMADTYRDEFTKVENAVEFVVNRVRPTIKYVGEYDFKAFLLEGVHKSLSGNQRHIEIPVLARESQEKFTRLTNKLFADAKSEPPKSSSRAIKMREAWAATRIFAKADYGYSVSAHRSQGSTYDKVIVNHTDMINNYSNDQIKASLIYTAGTRARNEVVMVNKNFNL